MLLRGACNAVGGAVASSNRMSADIVSVRSPGRSDVQGGRRASIGPRYLCDGPSMHIAMAREHSSLMRWRPLPTRRRTPSQRGQPEAALPIRHVMPVLEELGEGLEAPVQVIYLAVLLGFLVVGAYLIVRQVLIRRELEEAAKVLGERIRTGKASPEDCFELGVILLRKKLYTAATKNLERAKREWEGEPEELAQINNALGFAYLQMNRDDFAINNFRKAVELQPGYVIAWNNLGDAYEKIRDYENALAAYEETLTLAPDNSIALNRSEALRSRLQRLRG